MDMNQFFYQLDQLLGDKQYEAAETFMRESLAKAEADCDAGATIAICNELGGYYRATSRYAEGIPLYERALELIYSMGLTGTEHHGTTLVNYATTITLIGDVQKALELDTQAAEIFAHAGLATDYRLATLYNNMSFLCMDLGRFAEAETSLNDALYILKTLDEAEIDVAVTYSNLAVVYSAQNKLDEAKVSVKKALDIFHDESGDTDVHYAGAVCTLGEIYYKEGDFEKAATLFEKAMELTARDYGAATQSYAILLQNLAACCEAQGLTDKAADCQQQADAILKGIGL